MQQYAEFDYYRDAAAGASNFFARVAESFWHSLASKVGNNKSEIKYFSFLDNDLRYLNDYAIECGAESLDGLTHKFPLGGFRYSSNQQNPARKTLSTKFMDEAYKFENNGCPVYVLRANLITLDYEVLNANPCIFVSAETPEEVAVFLEKYYIFARQKNMFAVMNYRGQSMNHFRKMPWDQIYLPGDMLAEIRADVDTFFKSEEMYKEHGLDWRMGLMFAGSPGNGKTAVCRAIATDCKAPVIYCALDDDMYSIMHALKATTAAYAPCTVIIEDADTLGAEPAMRSNFLNMLDGLFTTPGVLTIASTNSPEKLDPAFTGRPSRFDCFYIFNNPAPSERKQIFLQRLGDKATSIPDKEVDGLIDKMEDLSAAAIQEVVVKALRVSLREKRPVDMTLLEDCLEKVQKHMTASDEGIAQLARGSTGFGAEDASPRYWVPAEDIMDP